MVSTGHLQVSYEEWNNSFPLRSGVKTKIQPANTTSLEYFTRVLANAAKKNK